MNRSANLSHYHFASTTFCVIVVLSNIISAKMIKIPLLSDTPLPMGLLVYPLTFLISDFVTEIYGTTRARSMIYLSLAMNLLAVVIIALAVSAPAVSEEDQLTFQAVMGLSGIRILSSLIAFLVSQIADVQLYALIRRWTGDRFLWLRSNVASYASQIIDTLLIDLLYLWWGLGMEIAQITPIILFSLGYKFIFTVVNTPLFYLSVFWAKKSLYSPMNQQPVRSSYE